MRREYLERPHFHVICVIKLRKWFYLSKTLFMGKLAINTKAIRKCLGFVIQILVSIFFLEMYDLV